jgi:hypothetical protein
MSRKVINILGQKHPWVSESLSGVNTPGANKPQERPSPVPPVPPKPTTIIVALLDFNSSSDLRIKDTLEYYFNGNFNFKSFPIVNTQGDENNTLNLLDKYYAMNYRIFLGFSNSAILFPGRGILDWFNFHPDCTPISIESAIILLEFPKSMYRLQPLPSTLVQLNTTIIIGTRNIVYLIYDSSILSNQLLIAYLESISGQLGVEIIYKPIDGASNITTENINIIMASIQPQENAVIAVSMLENTNLFYNVFDNTTPISGYSFYDLSSLPLITNLESQEYFKNILFVPDIANISTSILWRNGYKELGFQKYNSLTLNAMIMAYSLEGEGKYKNIENIGNLGSHTNNLIFNSVTRDNEQGSVSYSLYTFINGSYTYIPKIVGFKKSDLETYIGYI